MQFLLFGSFEAISSETNIFHVVYDVTHNEFFILECINFKQVYVLK